MRLTLVIALAFVFVAALSCAGTWDYLYEATVLPPAPIDSTTEVTGSPTITTDLGRTVLYIDDNSASRSRYGVNLSSLYGPGSTAGTVETSQRFVSSSNPDNIAVYLRQDTPGASAEIRVSYYDAGDGRAGLWNAKTGEYLGPTDTNTYYRLRMVLDGSSGGRLYINDSYFANLTPAPGGTSRLAFGAGSTLGTGEVYIDYFRWQHDVMAGPGEAGDPADPESLVSPRTTSLPSAVPLSDSVTITWTTDVASDSTVHWGTCWTCPNTAGDASAVTEHSVTIPGLLPGATYRFYVESSVTDDPDVARSGILSFTTPDVFRISGGPYVQTAVDGLAATVNWTTSFAGDSRLFFRQKGEVAWLESYNSAESTDHAFARTELLPNTYYEFYVLSTRAGSPDVQSGTMEFFTYVYPTAGTLLSNGGFELGNTVGWNTASGEAGVVHPGPWLNTVMPHAGGFFLGLSSTSPAKNGTVYQSVVGLESGDNVYASAWAYTYETDQAGAEEHDSAFCQVGVDVTQDPELTVSPNASTVRWSVPVSTANSGPWTCIGVTVPRNGSTHAIIFLRHIQTADGGTNTTCFDDASLTTSPPVGITSGPTVSETTPTSATIEWTTDEASTTMVHFGEGDLDAYQFTDYYLDNARGTSHSAVIRLKPNTGYVFQASSASGLGITLSAPAALSTPMNLNIENGGFEQGDTRGRPTLSPWTQFQFDIDQIPRFSNENGQPAGGPIDGLIGPYPAGGAGWNGTTCEPSGGSFFLGAYASMSNKNGGVYQKVQVTPGETYKASMRFLTGQEPIDGEHLASRTACAIAIDPMGGTDILSPALIWSADRSSTVNGEWDEVSVKATSTTSDTFTVFCVIEQQYTDTVHLNALDGVTFAVSPPVIGGPAVLRNQPEGTTVRLDPTIVTFVRGPQAGNPARIYVEEWDPATLTGRNTGIGILTNDPNFSTDTLHLGDKLSVAGTLSVDNGEAVIKDSTILSITPGSGLDVPPPLMLVQKALRCGPLGTQPGMTDGSGLSNTGLLVRVFGRVTSDSGLGGGWLSGDSSGDAYAYLEDGSALDGGAGALGVKILAQYLVFMNHPIYTGQYITAVGVASVEEVDGVRRPVVRISDKDTIVAY